MLPRIPHAAPRANTETSLERAMKQALQTRGVVFHEQYRIGRYIADFAIPSMRVVIECDGPHHRQTRQTRKDARRDAFMRNLGWRVYRFTTKQLRTNALNCLDHVLRDCGDPSCP